MDEIKIKKVESVTTYLVEEGYVKLKVNGKSVTVSWYRKEDYDLGAGCDADHEIHCKEELTDEEMDLVEETWMDYRD